MFSDIDGRAPAFGYQVTWQIAVCALLKVFVTDKIFASFTAYVHHFGA